MSLPERAIRGYWFFNLLGGFAAFALLFIRCRQARLPKKLALDAMLLALPLGLLCGRLFSIWIDGPSGTSVQPLLLAPRSWIVGGYVSFGAIAGALAALWIAAKCHRVSLIAALDLALPGLFLAAAFGRLACFVNNCCFGGTCNFPWAVAVAGPTAMNEPPDLRHPVQLYEASLHLVALACLLTLKPLRLAIPGKGQVAAVCLVGYGAIRLITDVFRAAETSPPWLMGWTFTQVSGSLLIVGGLWLWSCSRHSCSGEQT